MRGVSHVETPWRRNPTQRPQSAEETGGQGPRWVEVQPIKNRNAFAKAETNCDRKSTHLD
jgi:hypothetical protein